MYFNQKGWTQFCGSHASDIQKPQPHVCKVFLSTWMIEIDLHKLVEQVLCGWKRIHPAGPNSQLSFICLSLYSADTYIDFFFFFNSRTNLCSAACSAASRPQAAREDHSGSDGAEREAAAHAADLLQCQPET